MKQAYTNTIRGSGGNPLTIATGSKKGNARGKAKQQVPKCAYGSACNRKGCAFRHPERGASFETYNEDPRSKICKPFLAGLCTYENKCMNRHPGEEEAENVKAGYKQKVCSYGDGCQTEGCLYFHPYEALESAFEENYDNDQTWNAGLSSAFDHNKSLNGGNDYLMTQLPTYEEWIRLNCPAPPTIDANQVYNIWYHTSGMQRDPWDVYCLMYPKQSGDVNLKAEHNNNNTSWGPISNALQAEDLSAASRSWEPTHNDYTKQDALNSDPKSCEEWKRLGCTYPSWFCSDYDPWYDDEGVRRSLEEVYEVLYGEKAQSRFEELEVLRYKLETSADPTPAELTSIEKTKNESPICSSLPAHLSDSKISQNDWARVASKPATRAAQTHPSNNAKDDSLNTKTRKNKTVIMPKECWLPDTANANYFHTFPDPIARFTAINERHKSYLSSVIIPTSFDSPNPKSFSSSNGNVTVLDVHFQSASSIYTVLNQFLPDALEQYEELWIITGLGTHVEAGHQKRGDLKTGGVLFNAVKKYLLDTEMNMGVEWKYGKDANGTGINGAFLVRKKVT